MKISIVAIKFAVHVRSNQYFNTSCRFIVYNVSVLKVEHSQG